MSYGTALDNIAFDFIIIIKPEQAKFVTAYLVDNSDTASKLSSAPVWTP